VDSSAGIFPNRPAAACAAGAQHQLATDGGNCTLAAADRSITAGDGGLPRGVRLGIDVGKVRIGVAASDQDGFLAIPVKTVRRGYPQDVAEIAKMVRERSVIVAYVGLPKHMSGKEGEATKDARQFTRQLGAKLPDLEFRFIDERLTTVTATANLQAAGRKANRQRSVIDQQAAVIILQTALDAERISGQRAGTLASAGATQQ